MPTLLVACLMALLAFGLTFLLAEWAAARCLRRRGLVFEERPLISSDDGEVATTAPARSAALRSLW
jgi:hypothetical protein